MISIARASWIFVVFGVVFSIQADARARMIGISFLVIGLVAQYVAGVTLIAAKVRPAIAGAFAAEDGVPARVLRLGFNGLVIAGALLVYVGSSFLGPTLEDEHGAVFAALRVTSMALAGLVIAWAGYDASRMLKYTSHGEHHRDSAADDDRNMPSL